VRINWLQRRGAEGGEQRKREDEEQEVGSGD